MVLQVPARRALTQILLLKNMNMGAIRLSHTASPSAPKYKRWQDVPDSLIPTTSKRDPDNPIYAHPRYIAYRKQQIFFQQDDGVPVYFKKGLPDYIAYYGIIAAAVLMFGYSYTWIVRNQFYSKKKSD